MIVILSLSLICACFASPTTVEQLSTIGKAKGLTNLDDLPLLSTFNKEWNDEGVLVRDIPWMESMMGNRLSWYFDALICSDIVGLHFVWPSPPDVSASGEKESKFFNAFPRIVAHPRPSTASRAELVTEMKKTCPNVVIFPHEFDGAWSKHTPQIAAIMHNAIDAALGDVHNATISRDSLDYVQPHDHPEKELPLVPSAAILFRCVDILAGGGGMYGFVNFNVYTELIPTNATHIYVLTEKLNYMGQESTTGQQCVDIGQGLINFLHVQFPQAVIALRRGHAIDSVAIQANAKVIIAAPTTFALFPGIVNPHKVYLMPGLVFKEQPFLRDQFFWMTSPAMLVGASIARPHEAGALQKYMAALTAPLSEKVMCVTRTYKKVDVSMRFKPPQ